MVWSDDEESYRSARDILDGARSLAVISGAGMSAECGIPTFRATGDNDAWNAMARTLTTPEGFRADPQGVWSWYLQRRREALAAWPHAGYEALVGWERRADVHIVTQNVDGLHARAGSSRVVELHGTLHRVVCADCGHDVSGVSDRDEVPRCPSCGGYVRPAVVWFGEAIPEAAVQGEAEAMLTAEAVLLVGSSLAINTPARMLRSTERRGIPIVEVNPEPALPRAGNGPSTANR